MIVTKRNIVQFTEVEIETNYNKNFGLKQGPNPKKILNLKKSYVMM